MCLRRICGACIVSLHYRCVVWFSARGSGLCACRRAAPSLQPTWIVGLLPCRVFPCAQCLHDAPLHATRYRPSRTPHPLSTHGCCAACCRLFASVSVAQRHGPVRCRSQPARWGLAEQCGQHTQHLLSGAGETLFCQTCLCHLLNPRGLGMQPYLACNVPT